MKRRDFLAASAASAAAAGSGLLACNPSSATRGSEASEVYRPPDAGHLGIAHGSVWGRRGVTAAADYYASLAGTSTRTVVPGRSPRSSVPSIVTSASVDQRFTSRSTPTWFGLPESEVHQTRPSTASAATV